MTSSVAVESDDFGLWEPTTSRDEQLPNRGATWKKKAKRIRPFCFIFFHVFHDFHGVFHGAHMWCLTATKIWPTTGNITAWQENETWFDKRKLWRLETKHYVFHCFPNKTQRWCFAHTKQTKRSLWSQQWLICSLWQKLWMKCKSSLTLNSSSNAVRCRCRVVAHFSAFPWWRVQHSPTLLSTMLDIFWNSLKYILKTQFLIQKRVFFFSFSYFWFCDLACRARFGILGCEASTAIQVTTKKHAHTFSSLATSWFPTCWKTSRKTLFIHVDTCLYHTCSPCFCFWLQNQRKTERENSTKPLPRSEGHGRTSWRGHLGWPAPLQHTSKASFRLQEVISFFLMSYFLLDSLYVSFHVLEVFHFVIFC